MLKQPLFITSFVLIIIIGLVHGIATEFYLYWTFPWLDMPMHFLGGLWVGLSAIWYIYFSGYTKMDTKLTRKARIFSISLATVIVVGVLWEVFEIYSGVLLIEKNYGLDTSVDLLMDTIGGVTAFIYVNNKFLKNEQ